MSTVENVNEAVNESDAIRKIALETKKKRTEAGEEKGEPTKEDYENADKSLARELADADPFSVEAYEGRANEIFEAEKRGDIIGEIIEGPKMPLKILRNKFDKNSGKLVFLVHGTGMNEFSWAPVLKPLEEKGINALTYAWRGHSQSFPFDENKFVGTGLLDLVSDAESVLIKYKEELGIKDDDIIIAGHSFGTIINSYLARGRKFKSILNFCAGYPNEEYFQSQGTDTVEKKDITIALGKLWNFSSEEYIRKTLAESSQNKYFRSYREMGQLASYLSELFNLNIPNSYSGSLEKLLGPTSRVAVSEGLLNPPYLLKKQDIVSPMHFFAATEDKMVSAETISKMAAVWGGDYQEIPGPHAGTYSPHKEKYIEHIVRCYSK